MFLKLGHISLDKKNIIGNLFNKKSKKDFCDLNVSRRDWTRDSRENGTRCLIHRIEADIATHEERRVSRWQGAKSRRPPSGTRHSTREVLSGFSGAFKCFRSCLECHKRLLETKEETGFLIGPRRNPPYHRAFVLKAIYFFPPILSSDLPRSSRYRSMTMIS